MNKRKRNRLVCLATFDNFSSVSPTNAVFSRSSVRCPDFREWDRQSREMLRSVFKWETHFSYFAFAIRSTNSIRASNACEVDVTRFSSSRERNSRITAYTTSIISHPFERKFPSHDEMYAAIHWNATEVVKVQLPVGRKTMRRICPKWQTIDCHFFLSFFRNLNLMQNACYEPLFLCSEARENHFDSKWFALWHYHFKFSNSCSDGGYWLYVFSSNTLRTSSFSVHTHTNHLSKILTEWMEKEMERERETGWDEKREKGGGGRRTRR